MFMLRVLIYKRRINIKAVTMRNFNQLIFQRHQYLIVFFLNWHLYIDKICFFFKQDERGKNALLLNWQVMIFGLNDFFKKNWYGNFTTRICTKFEYFQMFLQQKCNGRRVYSFLNEFNKMDTPVLYNNFLN